MNNDFLKWAALAAALVATASAEYELARAVGFNEWVAAAVPGALDIYTVRAMRAHRDVLTAVVAMILVNAGSHLVTAGLLPVNVPLVVAVSAIAPLVLWRVHALRAEDGVPADSDSRDVVTGSPIATVERVPEAPTEAPTQYALDSFKEEYVPVAALAAETPRTHVSAPVPEDDDELVTRTRQDFSGRIPTYRELKETYGIGQPRARRIRAVLESELS